MIAFIRGIRTPLSTTSIPISARIASNDAGYLTSRSRIRNRARHPASWRSIARLRTAWVTHVAVGCAVAPSTRTRRLACSITARTYNRVPVSVTASKKSAARMASAWERRNPAQLSAVRSGAGSMPASLSISQTVDAATLIPRTSSSPWMRRYPHELFSRARRSTSARTDRTVGGRPARLGRGMRAWCVAIRSRCQRRMVSGRTSSRIWRSTVRGSRWGSAARKARSAGVNRTFWPRSCRSRIITWWRRARISASLARSLIDSSRSIASALVTPR